MQIPSVILLLGLLAPQADQPVEATATRLTIIEDTASNVLQRQQNEIRKIQGSLTVVGRFVQRHYQATDFLASLARLILRLWPSLRGRLESITTLQTSITTLQSQLEPALAPSSHAETSRAKAPQVASPRTLSTSLQDPQERGDTLSYSPTDIASIFTKTSRLTPTLEHIDSDSILESGSAHAEGERSADSGDVSANSSVAAQTTHQAIISENETGGILSASSLATGVAVFPSSQPRSSRQLYNKIKALLGASLLRIHKEKGSRLRLPGPALAPTITAVHLADPTILRALLSSMATHDPAPSALPETRFVQAIVSTSAPSILKKIARITQKQLIPDRMTIVAATLFIVASVALKNLPGAFGPFPA